MLDAAIIRQQLLEVAGVIPSSHWFEDCRAALQLSGQGHSSDAFLQQIIHHDLRDVVRELPESDQQENYGPLSEAAVALRQAQTQSMLASNQYKALLPSSFRLLVQLEEILDVSVNAQARYEHGPASNASPTPVGNQHKRCLKIVYSDGYDSQEILVATETSPIPSLSVQSKAGCKVILTGPIQLRHGMALWDSNTTFVLGGEVESLVQVQKAAIEQAKRLAGVGIDPTIKALIWTNQQPLGEDGEPQDEAEYESRDLPPPTRPIVNTVDPPQPIQNRTHSQHQSNNQSHIVATGQSSSLTSSRSTNPTAPASLPAASSFPRMPPQQPVPVATVAPRSITSQPNRALSQPRNPYANQNNRVSADRAVRSASPMRINSNVSSSHNSVTVVDLTESVESPTNDDYDATTTAAAVPLSVASDNDTLAYNQLLEILNLAIRDPAAYQQACGLTWKVQLQQVGAKEHFNIEKRKNRPKGDDRKYEYVMTAKFKGPGDLDKPITFKVDTSIVEPYFELSPADMRQLRKDDKDRANTLVREGGKGLYVELHQLKLYQVCLLHSPEEFFREQRSPTLDGPNPLMLLRTKLN